MVARNSLCKAFLLVSDSFWVGQIAFPGKPEGGAVDIDVLGKAVDKTEDFGERRSTFETKLRDSVQREERWFPIAFGNPE